VPFVQGRLRNTPVAVEIETQCRHCAAPLHITLDGTLQVSVREAEAKPLVFTPDVDWKNFSERTIIDAY
jgi:hypothetical protein